MIPTNVAILGATGTLGPYILEAISTHPKSVHTHIHILTRSKSADKANDLADRYATKLNITVHPVDYASPTELVASLSGVDVVISAVGDDSGLTNKEVAHTGLLPGFIAQDAVARAAKVAGVKLFLPSEYGSPTHSMPLTSGSYVVGKRFHHDLLREIDLPYLLVYAGMLSAIEPSPTQLPECTAVAPIPLGEPPFETSRFHLATYIVEILFNRGLDTVKGQIFVLRGMRRDRATFDLDTGKTAWVFDAGN